MNFNPWAVLVAAASSFVLGGFWYSKLLFGPAWGRASGAPPGGKHRHRVQVFLVSFVFAVIAAAAFAAHIGPDPSVGTALHRGFVVGAFFVAASFGINYQFADRSPILWLIDGGYHTVQFLLFGLVLGLWH
ncbi:MAG TPA: DUF1761 domain-containing protein [Planctomycetota bacterium]|jgi:hypothetical protein|nr:DUF1761 domain-containing protein [Planctomycetota bacterium]